MFLQTGNVMPESLEFGLPIAGDERSRRLGRVAAGFGANPDAVQLRGLRSAPGATDGAFQLLPRRVDDLCDDRRPSQTSVTCYDSPSLCIPLRGDERPE